MIFYACEDRSVLRVNVNVNAFRRYLKRIEKTEPVTGKGGERRKRARACMIPNSTEVWMRRMKMHSGRTSWRILRAESSGAPAQDPVRMPSNIPPDCCTAHPQRLAAQLPGHELSTGDRFGAKGREAPGPCGECEACRASKKPRSTNARIRRGAKCTPHNTGCQFRTQRPKRRPRPRRNPTKTPIR